jgi:hypothetical protein
VEEEAGEQGAGSRGRKDFYQSPITNHQSPITNHQSPITNHQLNRAAL